jgi:hypothetical protein
MVDHLDCPKAVDYAAAVAMVRKASARYYTIRKGVSPREGEE